MKSRFILSMLLVLTFISGGVYASPGEKADRGPVTVDRTEAAADQFTTQQNQQSIMSKEKTYTVKTPNPHFNGSREDVQFDQGTAEVSDEETAERLVQIWNYECEELEEQEVKSEQADGETQKSESGDEESEDESTGEAEGSDYDEESEEAAEIETFGDEAVEMDSHDGVAYPKQDNTNAGLKAFMDAHEIDYESDDNKEDLNLKIAIWVEDQTTDESEGDESGEADSQPESN